MALLGPSTNYTDKDFDALLARCQNLIATAFPEWTDQERANFGNILVNMFCFVGDVLTKYQDNQAAEAFIGRVTQRRNILALCKQIAYTPTGNTVAQVDVQLTATPAPTGTLTVPTRTKVRTEAITNPVVYETLADVIFPPGASGPITITAENAEQKSELFTPTNRANQEIKLRDRPYVDGSLVVTAGNGVYEVVSDFLDSAASDRHCVVVVDQNDRATVRFGNGINGAIPAGSITATYKIGGGTAGVVEANTLRKLAGTYTDSFGNAINVSVTNPSPSTIPADRQTVDEIRLAAPRSLRVLTRTVAREDYEINALRVPGIARALMLTSDQDPAIDENTGMLFIVPRGGGLPTQDMKDDVKTMVTVTYPNTLTFDVGVYDVNYLVVNIEAVVFLKPNVLAATAKANILTALAKAFAITPADASDEDDGTLDGIDFGYNLRDADGNISGSIAWSDVFDVIRDAAGVRKIDPGPGGLLLNGVRDDLAIEPRQFPALGTVTLINGDTSAPL
jgi:hypothetical protein